MIYDKEAILENSNAIDVADAIGMDIKRCGSTLYTNCVSGEHNESHVAHNQLFSTGCFCYTCGKRYDTVEMVINYYRNVLGSPITFPRALEIIADTCGGIDSYIIKKSTNSWKKKEVIKLPFSEEEFDSIGLLPKKKPGSDKVIVYVTDRKENESLIRKYDTHKDCYYYIKTKKTDPDKCISLLTLYKEDKKAFEYMCHTKAAERMEKYDTILRQLTQIVSMSNGKNEFAIDLADAIVKKKELCQQVYEKTSMAEQKIFVLS